MPIWSIVCVFKVGQHTKGSGCSMAKKRHGRAFVKVPRKRKRIPIEQFANRLRGNMTHAESILHEHLQKAASKWGVVFIPQGIVGGQFVADFVCYERRLVIEVDGSVHRLRSVKRKDAYRTEILMRLGYRIIRFTNKVVISNCTEVIKTIRVCLH